MSHAKSSFIKDNEKTIMRILTVVLVVGLLGGILLNGYFNGKKYKEQIFKNPRVAVATITGFSSAYKRSTMCQFHFTFEGEINHTKSAGNASEYSKLSKMNLIGKSFPVVFSATDPINYSHILITPNDFEEYGMKYPDSLKYFNQKFVMFNRW